MAAPRLRFQPMEPAQARPEAALHAPQSRQARLSHGTWPVALEQFPQILLWGARTRAHQSVERPEDEDQDGSLSAVVPTLAQNAKVGHPSNSTQYTGRDYDAETGLRYYRARYYDPAVGRFLTEDKVRSSLTKNLYRYVINNPVMLADPFGLTEQCVLVGSLQIPLVDSVTRENQKPWRFVGVAYAEEPDTGEGGYIPSPPSTSLACLWSRSYARVVWGNAIKVLEYQCTETNACGLPPRIRTKYDFKREHWFKSMSTETETEGTGPYAIFGATDEIYEYECIRFGPPWR